MNKRLKIYAYLWKLFSSKEFSIAEYSDCFSAVNARKVLGDLVRDGFISRTARGCYSCIAPEEFLASLVEDADACYKMIEESMLEHAFADKDAVLIWTEGYYWSGFKAGFYPITIEAREEDLKKWGRFFKSRNAEYFIEGHKPRETFVGVVFVLRPKRKIRKIKKDDYWVMPLDDTIKFCRENIYSFEPALEYLDKRYNLHKIKHYQYITA